ncbi:MAG: ATP-binding protein [Rhizobacter sp.]|nr:ATP-binding protein [Rhizobacter sp.]
MTRAKVVALLGAECTGKSTTSNALAASLGAEGHKVAVVAEVLREFCDLHRRTPLRNEQRAIADEQTARIDTAAQNHDIVIADTSALMIAVYSEFVFSDVALYASALAAHRRCDLTLLMALDLPWQPDGLQRDGAQVRAPVDALVRAGLQRAGLPYAVVFGTGPARLQAALACVRHSLGLPTPTSGPPAR